MGRPFRLQGPEAPQIRRFRTIPFSSSGLSARAGRSRDPMLRSGASWRAIAWRPPPAAAQSCGSSRSAPRDRRRRPGLLRPAARRLRAAARIRRASAASRPTRCSMRWRPPATASSARWRRAATLQAQRRQSARGDLVALEISAFTGEIESERILALHQRRPRRACARVAARAACPPRRRAGRPTRQTARPARRLLRAPARSTSARVRAARPAEVRRLSGERDMNDGFRFGSGRPPLVSSHRHRDDLDAIQFKRNQP